MMVKKSVKMWGVFENKDYLHCFKTKSRAQEEINAWKNSTIKPYIRPVTVSWEKIG
jgi:hypothetical protein